MPEDQIKNDVPELVPALKAMGWQMVLQVSTVVVAGLASALLAILPDLQVLLIPFVPVWAIPLAAAGFAALTALLNKYAARQATNAVGAALYRQPPDKNYAQ